MISGGSVRKVAARLILAAFLGGSALVLAPTQAQAKSTNCTPGPGLDLAGCNYSNADLSFVNFSGSNLTRANLSGADLNGTNFTGANLKQANLSGAGIVENCEFTGSCPSFTIDPGPAVLGFEYETSPNFTNANLKGAILDGVRLGGARLVGTVCVPRLTGCLNIEVLTVYPDATLTGVTSGGITGSPASLSAGWQLISGFLTQTIPPPQITTSSLPMGNLKVSYSASLAATGGNPPYKWSVVGGSLPPGLNIHSKPGTITGKPQVSGTYSFTVQVTDTKTMMPPHTQRMTTQLLSITIQ